MPRLSWRRELTARFTAAGVDPARQTEIVEEMALHLEDREAELVAAGLPSAEAQARLLAELDQGLVAREVARLRPAGPPAEPLGAPPRAFLRDLAGDVRYAARSLSKSRLFTAVTLISLALGVGANAGLFQLLDSLSMRELPVERPGELGFVRVRDRKWGAGSFVSRRPDLTYPMWEEIRDRQQLFSSIAASADVTFNVGELAPRPVPGLMVSGEFFDVLGVRAARGRLLGAADDRPGCAAAVAVVSHAFWQHALGGDPAVVGRALRLDGHPFQIVGVVPASFHGLEIGRTFSVAVPVCTEPIFNGPDSLLQLRHVWWLTVVGRLAAGTTLAQADAHLGTLSRGILEATLPPTYRPEHVERFFQYRFGVEPAAGGYSLLRDAYTTPLHLLLGIAGLVLLIACANLANLLLARASARGREIAVRLALGASRGRLVRQLMVESLLLALAGAALGLGLAHVLGDVLVELLATEGEGLLIERTLDVRVLGFTAGLAALTCVLFGLAPALRASRTDVGLVLKATSGRGATEGRDRLTLRRLLVVVQIALSFVLLVCALLFVRTLANITSVDPGFDRDDVVVAGLDFLPARLTPERRRQLPDELLERARALPGVTAAAAASIVPISGNAANTQFFTSPDSETPLTAYVNEISPGFFAALGTPLLLGRDVTPADRDGAPRVVVVNERLAREVAGEGSPIGRRLHRKGTPGGGPPEEYEIVGVVENSKYLSLTEPVERIAYQPLAQVRRPAAGLQLFVRAPGADAGVIASLRRTVEEIVPGALLRFDGLSLLMDQSIVRERLMASLSGFFGLLAALLATVGLYGVVAYGVARRTHEIGIRMALGAGGKKIARMVVREALVLVAIGVGAGLVLALVAARLTSSLLFGVPPHDPVTLVLAVSLLGAVAVLASVLPAWRAARVDPMIALRDE